MKNTPPRVQVSLINGKFATICVDPTTALQLARSLISQVENGDPNIGRSEHRTTCYLPEYDAPSGMAFTIMVVDDLDLAYAEMKKRDAEDESVEE
jgi:hypothetical protein